MISTLVVVIGLLSFSYVNYLEVNPLLVEILADAAIATSIAFSVWFFTTRLHRKSRKYIRRRIVESYLEIISICEGLINVPERRNNMDMFLDDINEIHDDIVGYADTHSHLLDAEEIETIYDEEILIDIFIERLRNDPTNVDAINEFYMVMITLWRRYIRIHKLTDFNENEYGVTP